MATIAFARLDDPEKMKFTATTGSGHEVVMDAAPAGGGLNRGPRPGELPLVGLAGCTGMDVISILRKMRQEVTRFEVEVEGLKHAEEHPKTWLDIRVTFHVEGTVEHQKLTRAIDLSHTRYCSVSATIKGVTMVHYRYILNGETVDLPDEAQS